MNNLKARYAAYEPDEWFTLSTAAQGGLTNQHFQVRDVDKAEAYIEAHPTVQTWSTMAVFDKDLGGNRKGSASEVSRCAWLWVDVDAHDNPAKLASILERMQAFDSPAPTQILFSGHGYQAYWAIEPTTDLEGVEERNNWLRYRLEGDHVQNVDRIMRVPGTLNTKEEPHVMAETISDIGTVYTFEDFTFPDGYLETDSSLSESLIDIESSPLPLDFEIEVRRLSKKLWRTMTVRDKDNKGKRSDNDYYVASSLLQYGFNPDVVLTVLTHPTWPSGDKGRTRRDYALQTIRKAHREVSILPVPEIQITEGDQLYKEGVAAMSLMQYYNVVNYNSQPYRYYEGRWKLGVSDIVVTTLAQKLRGDLKLEHIEKTIKLIKHLSNNNPANIEDSYNWVGVLNGLLNLRTRELVMPSKDIFVPIHIPVVYDEGAQSQELVDFVQATVEDSDLAIYEHLGWCLTPDVKLLSDPKMLILHGAPRAGKSELLHLVRGFLGEENGSTIGLEDLTGDKDYYAIGLLGMAYNMVFDAKMNAKWKNPDKLKDILVGDPTSYRRIYGDATTARSFAKFWVATNKMPTSIGTEDALYRRMLVVECPNVWRAETPGHKSAIGETLIKQAVVRSTLLNLALDGLDRLREHKQHTTTESMTKALNATREANSAPEEWRVNCTESGPEYFVSTGRAWEEYQAYCRDVGRFPGKKGKFIEAMMSLGSERPELKTYREVRWVKEKKNNLECWIGFKLTKSYIGRVETSENGKVKISTEPVEGAN